MKTSHVHKSVLNSINHEIRIIVYLMIFYCLNLIRTCPLSFFWIIRSILNSIVIQINHKINIYTCTYHQKYLNCIIKLNIDPSHTLDNSDLFGFPFFNSFFLPLHTLFVQQLRLSKQAFI